MNFERSKGPDLVPKEYAVEALGNARGLFELEAPAYSRDLQRTLFWALRLMQQRESVRRIATRVPGMKRVAFGFLDPEDEADAFGVIVFASPELQQRSEPSEGIVDWLSVDGHSFPVAVRRVSEERHQYRSAPHPIKGTGGAWARSRRSSGAIGPGALTAKHVVGSTIGQAVPMGCGCLGQVADVAPECIDVSLVSCGCAPTPTPPVLSACTVVPPGLSVRFRGIGTGGVIATTVTATTDVVRIYSDPGLPIIVILAHHGVPGDSGALVEEAPSAQGGARRSAVGIYLSSYAKASGTSGGLAQHAHQACLLMDMELLA
jgi:hypothetical protein